MRIFAFAFAFVIVIGAVAAPAAAQESQVCLHDTLGLLGVNSGDCLKVGETDALLDLKVGDAQRNPVTLTLAKGNETRTAATCNEYFAAQNEGFAVADPEQRDNQARFMASCEAAGLLIGARPAKHSYLGEWHKALRDVAHVSVDILPVVGEGYPTIGAPETVQSERDAGHVEILDSKVADLELRYAGEYAAYVEVVRADFNADDIEDVLVLVHTESADGKNRRNYPLPLSRFEAGGILMRADASAE